MNGFTDALSINPDHTTWNVTWTVLTQIQLNCVFFAGYISIFVLSPVFKYKALVCVLYSFIWVLTKVGFSWDPRSEKTLPTCFVLSACTSKFLFFNVFFHGACKPFNEPKTSGDWTHKYHKMALLFITHSWYWTFFYLLYLLSLIGIFFYYLFVLTYVDSLWRHTHVTTHPTGMQYFAPKWRHLMRFFAGATSRALALLLAFAAGNIKNLPRRLCAHEKIWARLVGKSVFDSKLRSLQRLIKESLAVFYLLFGYAVTL